MSKTFPWWMILAAGAFAAAVSNSLPGAIAAFCLVVFARAALFFVSGR